MSDVSVRPDAESRAGNVLLLTRDRVAGDHLGACARLPRSSEGTGPRNCRDVNQCRWLTDCDGRRLCRWQRMLRIRAMKAGIRNTWTGCARAPQADLIALWVLSPHTPVVCLILLT